ncbi:hypothetical protein LIER_43406 [Lithospermum erythrorhizon]|uniref:Uncharacterized protein n=1 Tax=Lithospermum erythrorhizon TaxID=34254 RepID=A0AAV3Q2S6_LITER
MLTSYLGGFSILFLENGFLLGLSDGLWYWAVNKVIVEFSFVISGKRILTNAHVVAHSTYIQVSKISKGCVQIYTAKVQAMGHECDLAILVIDIEDFWLDMQPLEFGNIPFLQYVVSVGSAHLIGKIKVVVSRIESIVYAHSSIKLLAIQIDALVTPDNIGAPVFLGDSLVVIGICFQMSDKDIKNSRLVHDN